MSRVAVVVNADRPGDGPAIGRITSRLVAGRYGAPGHIAANGEVVGVSAATLDANGDTVLSLERNDNIYPSGTFYEVKVPAYETRWHIRLVAGTASTVNIGNPTIQVP